MKVWIFWVLASAVGGAAGGATTVLEFVGPILLWGLALGAAQALVLWRYLREAAAPWVAISFVGWIVGFVIFLLVRVLVDLTGVPEIARRAGSVIDQLAGSVDASTTLPGLLVVWVVFAASQGMVLALVALAAGRRFLLPLAALWLLAGALGGVPAVSASYYLTNMAALHPGDGSGYPGQIVPDAIGQAAAGALYGAATGVVLVMITRRSAVEEDNA